MRPAANPTIAPAAETKTAARMRKRPTAAVIISWAGVRCSWFAQEQPRTTNRAGCRLPSGRSNSTFQPLRRPDQLFGVDLLTVFRRAVFIVVRDHQPIALKISAARHRPFHDHHDP